MNSGGWQQLPLKRLARVMPSNVDKHSVAGEQAVRLCNYVDVYKNERITEALDLMAATASEAQIERFALKAQDILVTKDSEEATDIGVPAYVPADLPGVVCGYHLAVLRPDVQRLYGGFLHWALQSKEVHTYFSTAATGITRYALSINDLEMTPIRLPSDLDEQVRITGFLDEQTAQIDALIAAKDALLVRLATTRESYAFALATQGNHATGFLSREEPWFPAVPRHWTVPKLGYLAEVGNGSTPRREVPGYWLDGTIPWVTSTAIHDGSIEATRERITEQALAECHLRMVRPGSTIVGLIGQGPTRGMAARLGIPATLSQNVAFVSARPESGVSDEYLTVALTGLYSAMRFLSDGVGGAHGAMNCEQLRALRIPKPSPAEQEAIVSEFRRREAALEALRVHAAAHIDRLREYRSSLISAAVTGQIEVGAFKEAA